MESKRVMMFVTVMMVLGNLLVQTEAQSTSPFRTCYPPCILSCAIEKKFPNALTCPFTCIIPCLAPKAPAPKVGAPTPLSVANETDDLEYFCKIGCATHHCVSVSSDLQNLNVDKVADCVDSCSEKCSNKN